MTMQETTRRDAADRAQEALDQMFGYYDLDAIRAERETKNRTEDIRKAA